MLPKRGKPMRVLGIDPGLRNIGVAVLDGHRTTGTTLTILGTEDPVTVLKNYIQHQGIYYNAPYLDAIGVEAYGNFGPRRGAFKMLELIGAVRMAAAWLGVPLFVFMPKEKERVSRTLSRPKGQTDHEFDARCIAVLARHELMKGTK